MKPPSSFQTADDWHDQEKASKWDKRVVVTFQDKAWVDSCTHFCGLWEVLGPVNDASVLEV
jgi:hypothetical protein